MNRVRIRFHFSYTNDEGVTGEGSQDVTCSDQPGQMDRDIAEATDLLKASGCKDIWWEEVE